MFSYGDVDGKGIDAKLQHPLGVAYIPSNKSLIVVDSYNHKIKIVQDLDQRAPSCQTIQGIVLNEPGGLSLSRDSSTLYVADTNNHMVQAVDLSTYTMREIEPILPNVDCTDEGRTKSKVLDIYLPEGSGTFKLELQLNVGKSAHLNRDAPSTWKMTLPPGWQNESGQKGPIGCDNVLCFDIHYNLGSNFNTSKDTLINITIKAYLCNDKDSTCFCSQNNYIFKCRKSDSNASKGNNIFQFLFNLS